MTKYLPDCRLQLIFDLDFLETKETVRSLIMNYSIDDSNGSLKVEKCRKKEKMSSTKMMLDF